MLKNISASLVKILFQITTMFKGVTKKGCEVKGIEIERKICEWTGRNNHRSVVINLQPRIVL